VEKFVIMLVSYYLGW